MLDHPPAPRHGGALRSASARYGVELADWLDLSTGINPRAYPLSGLLPEDFQRLPDPAALADLLAVARGAYAVPVDAGLVAVPGSDLALRLLPQLSPPGDVAIVEPTYSGHAEAWRQAGRTVWSTNSLGEAVQRAAIVTIVNPNNPDGRSIRPGVILRVAERLKERGGLLVVDEAFGDVAPGLSVVPDLGALPIVVLRSFGKFYGLAGLRLGFVLGEAQRIERLGYLVGEWPVSGPAISIGRKALADSAWQSAARERLEAARGRLQRLLEAAGLEIEGGTDLFLLVRTPKAAAIHDALARDGIWTRIFANWPDRIRIGLPPDAGFDRLEAALGRIGRGPSPSF